MSNNGSKLSKEKLLRSEYDQYKQIGEPDFSQNWLEMFTPAIVSDLFRIMNSCSDNTQKKDYIQEELELYGFEELGLGTNVYAMWHPAYPGVTFKVALDTAGLADNYNDEVLYGLVNKILTDAGKKPRYTRCLMRHPTGIVSVQERKVLVKTQDRMDVFRGSIIKTLQLLSEHFLIVDMSPALFQFNYGIERNGDWCFIDASDLYPLVNVQKKLRCTKAIGSAKRSGGVVRCNGALQYTEDFSYVVCARCGKEYIPSEFRPNDKEEASTMANAHMDGLSREERDVLQAEELRAIHALTLKVADEVPPSVQQIMTESTVVVPEEDADEDYDVAEVDESRAFMIQPDSKQETTADKVPGLQDDESGKAPESIRPPVKPEPAAVPAVPRSIFWNPNGPKPNVMNRDGGVERIKPGSSIEHGFIAPSDKILQETHTSFSPVPVHEVSGPDDDEPEEGIIEVPGEAPIVTHKLSTSIFESDKQSGILIDIPAGADFDDLYDEHMLDIWVSIDGGVTRGVAVQANALKRLIKETWEDLQDM